MSGALPRRPVVVEVRPEPEAAVLAAIVAAVDQAWPRHDPGPGPGKSDSTAWRFSGRWWAKPVPARRDRPWLLG